MSNSGKKINSGKLGCGRDTKAKVLECIQTLRNGGVKIEIPAFIDALVARFATPECWAQFELHQNGAVKGFIQLESHYPTVKKPFLAKFPLAISTMAEETLKPNPFDPATAVIAKNLPATRSESTGEKSAPDAPAAVIAENQSITDLQSATKKSAADAPKSKSSSKKESNDLFAPAADGRDYGNGAE